MRKRERENPCSVCGHYHKYEEGEVCGICGHRSASSAEKTTTLQVSAFPSEILPDFLYLGSYDNASRSGLLKTQGISRVLNVSFLFFYCCLIEIWIFFFLLCLGFIYVPWFSVRAQHWGEKKFNRNWLTHMWI